MSSTVAVVSSEEYARMPLEQKANAITYEQRAADIALAEKKEAEEREREKRSPYTKFAQVNLDHEVCEARRRLIKDCPCAMIILEFLMEQADKLNAIICSQTVLSEVLGYDKCTVSRAMKVLKARHFIGTMKSGNATVYLLNKQLLWKSWGTNYKYGKFEAVVLVSESEQDKEELEKPIIQLRTPAIEVRKSRKKNTIQPVEIDQYGDGCVPWYEDSLPTEGEPPEE